MAQVNVYQYAEIQLGDGSIVTIGSRATPKTISLTGTGTMHRSTFTGVVGDGVELLRVGSADGDDISGFVFLAVRSSVDATLAWVGLTDGSLGDLDVDSSEIGLEGGAWMFFFSDQTTEHNGDPVNTRAANTAHTITKMWVKPSASATVDVIALK